MRTALVGGPGTQLYEVRTRCCRRPTRSGETVLWTLTRAHKGESYTERLFVLHVTCALAQCAAAPAGNDVLSRRQLEHELAEIRSESAAAVARRAS